MAVSAHRAGRTHCEKPLGPGTELLLVFIRGRIFPAADSTRLYLDAILREL